MQTGVVQLLQFRWTYIPAAETCQQSGNKRLPARLGVDVEGGAHDRGIIWLRQVCVAAQQVEAGARVVLVVCQGARELRLL